MEHCVNLFVNSIIRNLTLVERLRFTYRNDNIEATVSARTRMSKPWNTIKTATANTTWNNPAYQGENLEQILDDCRERYRQNVGQEPQEEDRVRKVKDKKTGLYKEVRTAGWSPIREGVCPVKEDTTLADFAPVIAWLEERGVHVISISLHRDEGHEDPVTGERKYNHHGHVVAEHSPDALQGAAEEGVPVRRRPDARLISRPRNR